MRSTIFAVAITVLLWGIPAFADVDFDSDGVGDQIDNCSEAANTAQDDTDGDDCGNSCDADYNDDGVVGHPDVFEFGAVFGTKGNEEKCHIGPVPGCFVSFQDLAFLVGVFGESPGPSGTTAGTTACP
jgi:hypothetical protein